MIIIKDGKSSSIKPISIGATIIIVYIFNTIMNREILEILQPVKKNTNMKINMRAFTTDIRNGSNLLNRMYQMIERTTQQEPHPGLIISAHHFKDPCYPLVNEITLLSLVTMDLLIKYGYPIQG